MIADLAIDVDATNSVIHSTLASYVYLLVVRLIQLLSMYRQSPHHLSQVCLLYGRFCAALAAAAAALP